jgi:hypothetical protein
MLSRFVIAFAALGYCTLDFGPNRPATAAATDRNQRRTELPEKEDVERLLERQEVLGRSALAVLTDPWQGPEVRRDAALMLGRLRHRPAVPFLIMYLESLELVVVAQPVLPGLPPGIGNATVDWEGMYPCVVALADMGMDAVPAIVHAYLDEKENTNRDFLLYYSINRNRDWQAARRYIMGLKNEHKNEFQRRRLDDLVKDLPKD